MMGVIGQLLIIGEQVLIYVPLMLGGYLAISLMQIPNLSIESAILMGALGGGLVTNLCSADIVGLCVGLGTALIIGFFVGMCTGLLHHYGKLSHLLSSIVMLGACHGLSLLIMGASHRTLSSSHNPLMLLSCITSHPTLPVLVGTGGVIALLMLLFVRTRLGLICAIYGDNSSFLTNHKLSSVYVVCAGLGIANALAGVTGFLLARNNGFVDIGMATGVPLLCITALMLGQLLVLRVKTINIPVPFFGVLFYFIGQTVLLKTGVDVRYFPLVQAACLTLIFISQRGRKRKTVGI